MNLRFPPAPIRTLPPDLLAQFIAIVGPKNAVIDRDAQTPFLIEQCDLYRGETPVVLRPGSAAEVSAILKLANETKTAIVPQGGNTGLVHAQVPHDGEVVLSLTRLDKVREVDPVSNTITVESGVTLQRAREAAEAVDRLYPQLLPSEGSCTIGGNLSTNAGGTAALTHGVARAHALGLEVVLADGRIMNNLNKLKKDNTGYDLKNLFIGAEGTLGVITAAVLRLVPRPRSVEVAFLGVPSPQAALDILTLATSRSGGTVTAIELMIRAGLETVVKHDSSSRDPFPTAYPWYVLLELSSQQRDGLRGAMEEILGEAYEKGLVLDAAIADSLDQAKMFWRIREIFGAMQRFNGVSVKHDVSVPPSAVPAFLDEATAAAAKVVPGCRPLPFGHIGDGNMHYHIAQPSGSDAAAFLTHEDAIHEAVFAVVQKHGGSISAEHGIGWAKRDLLPHYKDPVALDLMYSLKRMLDPNGILNPGKVLRG